MHYTETIEKSAEYLRLALKYMGEYKIPVNPVNYLVWYEYVAGGNQKLRKAVDSLLKENRPFTSELNNGLYKRFISDEQKLRSEQVFNELRRLLMEMPKYIDTVQDDVERVNSALESYNVRLGSESEIDAIRGIVDSIVKEAKTLVSSSVGLRERLASTREEIEYLRSELKEIKGQATTDALTGLPNRMAFDVAISREINMARSSSKELVLIFADIDHFKRINDSFGHLVGDMMLKMTAETIKLFIKGKDFASRYGGEEFVVILPDTPLSGAAVLAEKIRAHFEKKKWTRKDTGEPVGAITLSFGIARYRNPEPENEFIQRADKALYASKEAGRNRVTVDKG